MDKSSKQWHNENARLMLKAADGDKEAFMCLHERLAPLLMHLFVKWGVDLDLAEDLVQKVFIILWQQRKNYRPQASLETYLLSIARNTLYKELRHSHKNNSISSKQKPVSDEGKYSTLTQPEAELHLEELTDAHEAAKSKLTNEQIQALEIAQEPDIELNKKLEKLGCSKEAHKKRLKRGRKRLMELLDKFFTDKNG